MQFNSFADFINMGGYGFYVWLSYGMGLVVLVGIIFTSKAAHKKQIKAIKGMIKREQQSETKL